MRELYEGIFLRRSAPVCRYFAEQGDIAALETLYDKELLLQEDIEEALEIAVAEGRTQATGCLLELKHRRMSTAGIDLSL